MQGLTESQRIELSSLDNPGWALRFVTSKPMGSSKKEIQKIERSESDWMDCWIEGSSFFAFGGINNLKELALEFEKNTSLEFIKPQIIGRLEEWLGKFKAEPEWYHSSGFNLVQTRNNVELSVCLEHLDWQETNHKLNLFFNLKPEYSFNFDNDWLLKISRKDGSSNEVIEVFLNLFEDEEVLPYDQ